MNKRIDITLDQGVAHVRLARADKMNALDRAMFAALLEAGEQLRDDTTVRAVVLSGDGKGFCAGLDMQSFGSMEQGTLGNLFDHDLAERTHGIANLPQQVALIWREVPVPVIAAVHGVAFGGGLQLALGADMRFVAPDCRLSVMEIKWGLVPDMGGMLFMRELVRPDIARDLTFTGRVFSGAQALEYGLATRTCDDPLAEALALARDIVAKSPSAIRAAKRLLDASLVQDDAGLLLAESVEQEALIGGEHQREAVRANLEKRAPVFG